MTWSLSSNSYKKCRKKIFFPAWLEKNAWLLILFIAIGFYVSYWTSVDIYRIETFQAAVFDLGAMMQELYLTVHTYPLYLINVVIVKFASVYLAPLYYFHSYVVLVFVQTIFIAAGAFPVYGIAKHKIGKSSLAFLFGVAYLLYPALTGPNWFDVHNQAFFMIFFIFGYYFYLKERFILAGIFFITSGLTRYPYIVFPFIFSLITFLDIVWAKRRQLSSENGTNIKFSISLFTFSLVFLILGYLITTLQLGEGSTAFLHISSGQSFDFLNYQLTTLLMVFGPVLFLTFFSPKWLLLLVPFLFLLFFSNDTVYLFPTLFRSQYTSMIISPVIIGTIEGTATLSKFKGNRGKEKNWNRMIDPKRASKITAVLIVTMAMFATYIQPYGPLNSYSGENFNTSLNLQVYSTLFAELRIIDHMVPSNVPNVVFGNNNPLMLPRPQEPNGPFLSLPYELSNNLTYLSNYNTWVPVSIGYMVANPYGSMFNIPASAPFNLTVYSLFNRLYTSGSYGIVAEASGITLIERNYSGKVNYFIPFDQTLGAQELASVNGVKPNSSGILISGRNNDLNAFNFLAPGYYYVNFSLSSSLGNFTFKINSASQLISSNILTFANGTINGIYLDYSVKIYVDRYYLKPVFNFYTSSSTSQIYLNKLSVSQY